MLTIEEIKKKIANKEFFLSQHAVEKSAADMITDETIEYTIRQGDIIESYPSDPRGESCLVNGQMPDGRYLH